MTVKPLWKSEALKHFPEWSEMVNRSETPYQLWTDLFLRFQAAYEEGREDTISAIYQFAWWCCEQPRGQSAEGDLLTCVTVTFFEDIPAHPKVLKDMPRWWSLEQVRILKDVFSYMVGEEGYARILAAYDAKPNA